MVATRSSLSNIINGFAPKVIHFKGVGIIGGSGFIGSYVTRKFLENGFQVRVSATDLANEDKYRHLRDLPQAEHLEIVPLNTLDAAALQSFVAGCDIVVHSGTPFQLETENPQTDMFDPTVKGTENFLEAVSAAPTVQKVVFIASVAAHNTHFPLGAEGCDADHLYTEADTPFVSEASNPYAQAKYYADQVVRRFTQEHPNLPFEIVSVSPVIVVGKALSARQDSTSMGMQYLIQNKIAPNDFLQFLYDHDVELAMVDVDDVAEAVFQAATTSGLHGKHYLLSSESWKVSDTSLMLNRQAPVGSPRQVVSNSLARQELGMTFKPAQVPLNQFGT